MTRVFCGLVALSLVPGMSGSAKADYIYTRLDVPSAIFFTYATGINSAGQVVGTYQDADGVHGFLLSEGDYATIDPPGSTYTEAHGINSAGQIVGTYRDAAGTMDSLPHPNKLPRVFAGPEEKGEHTGCNDSHHTAGSCALTLP
jgi:probable HAF family extracellular repeat protein